MRKISVTEIKGTETLARDVYTNMDTILMCAGTPLRKEYGKRLKNLDVDYIYVEDEISKGVESDEILELQIKKQCQEAVRDTMIKYSYCGSAELESLKGVAMEIIDELLEKKEVLYSVEGIRQKSETIYSHSLNVCAMSVFIGLQMHLRKKHIVDIAVGGLLHDIGYRFLEEEDFLGREVVSEETMRRDRMHVVEGYAVVEKEKWLTEASKKVILLHHERLDGSGYPFHLTDRKIGIEPKIVAVCDSFDRMVYGIRAKKQKVYEVLEYIVGMGGKKYDQKVVDAFYRSVAVYPNGTLVVTNEDEEGIVLKQNKSFPTRPVLRMLKDKDGRSYGGWVEKDLERELTLFIKDTIE